MKDFQNKASNSQKSSRVFTQIIIRTVNSKLQGLSTLLYV